MSHDAAVQGPAIVVTSSAVEALSVLGDAFDDIEVVSGGGVAEALDRAGSNVVLVLWDGVTASDADAAARAADDIQLALGLHGVLTTDALAALSALAVRGAVRLGRAPVLLLGRSGVAPLSEATIAATRLATSITPPMTARETLEQLEVVEAHLTHQNQELAGMKASLAELEEQHARLRERNGKLRAESAAHEKTLTELRRLWLGRRALLALERASTARRPKRALVLLAVACAVVIGCAVALVTGADATNVLLAVLLLLNAVTVAFVVTAAQDASWERRESGILSEAQSRRLDRYLRRVDKLINSVEAAAAETRSRFQAQESRMLELTGASHEARRAIHEFDRSHAE